MQEQSKAGKKSKQMQPESMSSPINYPAYDLSIGSTETKYIKLNTKTQTIFCFLNENLTTFLCTLTRGTRKQKEKKVFFLMCIQELNVIRKNLGFSI